MCIRDSRARARARRARRPSGRKLRPALSRFAQVIAHALTGNDVLERFKFDGNSPGRIAAAAFIACVRKNSRGEGAAPLDVTMKNCDTQCLFQFPSGMKLFDPLEPAGEWVGDEALHLERPYDRMVAEELLRLATVRESAEFTLSLIHI